MCLIVVLKHPETIQRKGAEGYLLPSWDRMRNSQQGQVLPLLDVVPLHFPPSAVSVPGNTLADLVVLVYIASLGSMSLTLEGADDAGLCEYGCFPPSHSIQYGPGKYQKGCSP